MLAPLAGTMVLPLSFLSGFYFLIKCQLLKLSIILSLSDCLAIVFSFTFYNVLIQLMWCSGVGPISRHNGPSPFPNNHISRPMPPPAYNHIQPNIPNHTQIHTNTTSIPNYTKTHPNRAKYNQSYFSPYADISIQPNIPNHNQTWYNGPPDSPLISPA